MNTHCDKPGGWEAEGNRKCWEPTTEQMRVWSLESELTCHSVAAAQRPPGTRTSKEYFSLLSFLYVFAVLPLLSC